MSAWITTFTGKKFHLLDPQPDEICIEDIAHSLSLLCRFTGQCKYHYSVGMHSLLVADLVPQEDKLWALLHDASEAYLNDMSRPLKHETAAGREYTQVEEQVMAAIVAKFELPLDMPASVRKADETMLATEMKKLLPPLPDWEGRDWETAPVTFIPVQPHIVENLFLEQFRKLTGMQCAYCGQFATVSETISHVCGA